MDEFGNILALDTALGGCAAACVAGERSSMKSEVMPRGQAEYLVPFANEVIKACDVSYDDLDAVICTIGPGAFTGLRIGMSAARAFGLSLDIPVLGVSTLQALAIDYFSKYDAPCVIILESKRSDFYVQSFNGVREAVSESQALEVDEIIPLISSEHVLIGDGVERFNAACSGHNFQKSDEFNLPNLVNVIHQFQEHGSEGGLFVRDAQPLYLRGADVSFSKKQLRKLESIK